MVCCKNIEAHTDSGFCKEYDKDNIPTGRATKGANFLRMGRDPTDQHSRDIDKKADTK